MVNPGKQQETLADFLKELAGASLLAAIVIPAIILLFQGIIFRIGLDGGGLGAIWWALLGTPVIYIALPFGLVTLFGLLVGLAPGEREPLDTIKRYAGTLIKIGMTMTLVNVFAMFAMGFAFARLAHRPEYLNIATAAAIALGAWSFVFHANATWFKRLSAWLFAGVIASIAIEIIHPGSLRTFFGYTQVSTTVMSYEEAAAQRKQAEEEKIRTAIAKRGMLLCDYTDPNTWTVKKSVGDKECAITKKELEVWNRGKPAPIADTVERTVRSIRKSPSSTAHRSGGNVKNGGRTGKCKPTVTEAASGDEITISFPTCYAGRWEYELTAGLAWHCEVPPKQEVTWYFGVGGTATVTPRTGIGAVVTEEFSHPFSENGRGNGKFVIDAYRLYLSQKNRTLSAQWNVQTTPGMASVANFWNGQKDAATIHCSATL